MYGRNALAPRVVDDGASLTVQEVFRTIQGEGPSVGTPATFVRLWGCHLRCYFCDTDFESNAQRMTVHDVLAHCMDGPRLVVLTGGEPMRQNIVPLVEQLIRQNYFVQIETAGSFAFAEAFYSHLPAALSIIVSPKTAHVDEMLAHQATAFKYVVSAREMMSPEDGLPVVDYQREQHTGQPKTGTPRKLARPKWMHERPHDIFVQPMDENDKAQNAANVMWCVRLAQMYGYRLSLQTHKLLGLP